MVWGEMTSITLVQILAISVSFSVLRGESDSLMDRAFTLAKDGEAVASITAGCAACDWAAEGREAAVLSIAVDGAYSQHLLLTRGSAPAEYRIMLGSLKAGTHRLSIARDVERSANGAGDMALGPIDVQVFPPDAPEYAWLSHAPMLRA